MKSQLHQRLHSIARRKARLGHNLPRLLRHLRHRMNLAQLIRMIAQLFQDIGALLGRSGGKVVVADSDDGQRFV
jgi:hypothetical protein